MLPVDTPTVLKVQRQGLKTNGKVMLVVDSGGRWREGQGAVSRASCERTATLSVTSDFSPYIFFFIRKKRCEASVLEFVTWYTKSMNFAYQQINNVVNFGMNVHSIMHCTIRYFFVATSQKGLSPFRNRNTLSVVHREVWSLSWSRPESALLIENR